MMIQKNRLLMMVGLVLLLLGAGSRTDAEEHDLQYFLEKAPTREGELSKKDQAGLLNRIDGLLGQIQKVHRRLTETIQAGEVEFRYQEGKFWMTKLDADRRSIETGLQQLKLMREKPGPLVASIGLYKSLRDLASNLNAYNGLTPFSAIVGDLSSEAELWADPVFFEHYLLPLARAKEGEKAPPSKENKKGNGKKKPSPDSPPQPSEPRKR
jgi:hypothetical protein